MKLIIENSLPEVMGNYSIKEMYGTYVLYMPIKMKRSDIYIPENFEGIGLGDLLQRILNTEGHYNLKNKYVYLSFETSYVEANKSQKRPGWHIDGFLSDDINYLWYSNSPTIFNSGKFELSQDHSSSIQEMNEQALEENNVVYPNGTLLRLDNKVVHKAQVAETSGVRTFVKISISDNKYNLKGNTRNPLLNYNWEMYDRSEVRNHPIYKENDSVPENFKENK